MARKSAKRKSTPKPPTWDGVTKRDKVNFQIDDHNFRERTLRKISETLESMVGDPDGPKRTVSVVHPVNGQTYEWNHGGLMGLFTAIRRRCKSDSGAVLAIRKTSRWEMALKCCSMIPAVEKAAMEQPTRPKHEAKSHQETIEHFQSDAPKPVETEEQSRRRVLKHLADIVKRRKPGDVASMTASYQCGAPADSEYWYLTWDHLAISDFYFAVARKCSTEAGTLRAMAKPNKWDLAVSFASKTKPHEAEEYAPVVSPEHAQEPIVPYFGGNNLLETIKENVPEEVLDDMVKDVNESAGFNAPSFLDVYAKEIAMAEPWKEADRVVSEPEAQRFKVMIARFPGNASEHPDSSGYVMGLGLQLVNDPRISSLVPWKMSDTPITMCRNQCIKDALAQGVDYLLMIDSDMKPDYDESAPTFWDVAWRFMMYERSLEDMPAAEVGGSGPRRPATIAAPYCGPPPHECVYVFQWENQQTTPDANFALKMIHREDAARRTGIEEVAALPTGLILYDMRVFHNLAKPWFAYEWADAEQTVKASTEDVYQTRNASLVGMPQYVAWDCWAGHWKQKLVMKPAPLTIRQVNQSFAQAIVRGAEQSVPNRF